MKRVLVLLLAGLCFVSTVQAVVTLKGRVVNSRGEPLVAVSVVTDLAGVGIMTDANGDFSLRDDGQITRLTFSSIGYHSRQFRKVELPAVIVLEPLYYEGTDIIVHASRAPSGVSAAAFSNYSERDIARDYTISEFPLLLGSTPNLYAYSDGGGSLGYSYMRIRGFDDKRVSTYINGVPLNDPEDQATYFVDLPDFAANVSDIQVQRGVGNSLYGDASFGGSVNIVTSSLSRPRQTSFTAGYGEYTAGDHAVSDMYKQSLEYSSGLVDGRWAFAGRFSKQRSGGYRHNSWYQGWAYSFTVARLDPNMTTELHVYGGPMRMHLAYYGSGRAAIDKDRRDNPLTYDNETDNFNQPHYQLHHTWRLGDRTTLSNSLYYIRGQGYYEQYKDSAAFFDYAIDTLLADIDPVTHQHFTWGNLVRQQWVAKNQHGWNPRLDVTHKHGQHTVGGSFYYFDSDHWGQVVWAQNVGGPLDPTHKYYEYYGKKWVGSLYGQEYYRLTNRLTAQVTAQLRYQRYKFDQQKMGAFKGYRYDLHWVFFSPRVGLSYKPGDRLEFFTNFAVSSRTPTDADIYDANNPNILPSLKIEAAQLNSRGDTVAYRFGDPTARNERVYDFELGGQYRAPRYSAGVNLFWMDFKDEIIPEGGINPNTGLLITTNADRSVHAGVELTGAVKPIKDLTVSSNFSFNRNRIKKYVADIDGFKVDYKDKTIPGFPGYLGNFILDYNDQHVRATYRLRVVGEQYMELLNLDRLAINPYSVSSLSLSYTFAGVFGLGNLTFSARVDNLFDKKFEASGYGGNYAYSVGPGEVVVDGWAEYFVAAERSFFGQVKMELF